MDILPNEILYCILHSIYERGNIHEFLQLCRVNTFYYKLILHIIKTQETPNDMAKLAKFKLTKDGSVLEHVDWETLGSLWTNAHHILIYYLSQVSYPKRQKLDICTLYSQGISSSGFNPSLYDEFINLCIQKLNIYVTRDNRINTILTRYGSSNINCESKLLHTIKVFTRETGYTYHTNYKKILGLLFSYNLISKCCELYPSQMISIGVMLKLPLKGTFEDKHICIKDVDKFWKQLQHKRVKIDSIASVLLKQFASQYSTVFNTIEWETDGTIITDPSILNNIIFGQDSQNLIKQNSKHIDNALPEIQMELLSEQQLKQAMNTSIIEILQPIIFNDDIEKFMDTFECVDDKNSVLHELIKTFTLCVPIQILTYLKIIGYEVKLIIFQDELPSLSSEKVDFVLSNNYVMI